MPSSGIGKNVIILEADMSTSVHDDDKGKDILILGKGPMQVLDGTTLTAEKKYPINFAEHKKIVLACIMEQLAFYLLMVFKINKFEAKDSEINPSPLCLG